MLAYQKESLSVRLRSLQVFTMNGVTEICEADLGGEPLGSLVMAIAENICEELSAIEHDLQVWEWCDIDTNVPVYHDNI